MVVISSKSLKKILGLLSIYFVRKRIDGSIIGPLHLTNEMDIPHRSTMYDHNSNPDGFCAYMGITTFATGGKVVIIYPSQAHVGYADRSSGGYVLDTEINSLKNRVTLLETKV